MIDYVKEVYIAYLSKSRINKDAAFTALIILRDFRATGIVWIKDKK